MVPGLNLSTEDWEDICRQEGGWEYIDGKIEAGTNSKREEMKNEFREKVGLERLKEALEANEWESSGGGDNVDEEENGFEKEIDGWGDQAMEETDVDLANLKKALLEGEKRGDSLNDEAPPGDADVQALESMMLKMQAVRDMGASMPEEERKKFAAKTVRDVMRNL